MEKEKKYPRVEFNDKFLKYNLTTTLFILFFTIVFLITHQKQILNFF
ncbi:hypothetical protein [Rodentibacter caecimuris]